MKEYKYKINGTTYTVTVGDIEEHIAHVEVNGTPYNVELDKPVAKPIVSAPRPAAAPRTETGEKVISKPAATSTGAFKVVAPLPGVVLEIQAKVGDTVKASDTIMVLEAMKMENAIHAGRDGKISAINVEKGESVLEGAVLLLIE